MTKYFKLSDRHYYEGGNFKLGTLEEYRSTENKLEMGSRLDPNDGVRRRVYSGKYGSVVSENIMGIFYIEGGAEISFQDIVFEKHENDWVFCASFCSYTPIHHSRMLYGDKSFGYSGNPKLLGWATIDIAKFIDALRPEFVRILREKGISKSGDRPSLYFNSVTYDKIDEHHDIRAANDIERQSGFRETLRAIFSKPSLFSPEDEIRFLIRSDERINLQRGAKPLYLRSQALRHAIIDIGP